MPDDLVYVRIPLTELRRLAREAGQAGAEAVFGTLSKQHGEVLGLVERTGAHKDVLSTREAAFYANVKPDTIRRWIAAGMPATKRGGQAGHIIRRTDLDAWRTAARTAATL